MAGSRETREIIIKVESKGDAQIKKISRELGKLSSDVQSLSGFGRVLQGALGFTFLGVGVGQITAMSDSMQVLGDRLSFLTGSSENASAVMKDLLFLANDTKTSIDSLATIYTRLAASTREAGLSSGELLSLVEVLQNSFRLSGSTTEEATNAVIQLSQAFSKGKLDGDEFRTVMEQNVVVANLLKKEYGKDIYKKAKDGAIQITDVLRILFRNQKEINASAKELGQTFSQTIAVSLNEAKFAIDELNKKYNLSEKFADLAAIATKKFGLILVALAVTAIPLVIGALSNLTKALLANPATFIAAGVLALSAALVLTFDSLEDFIGSAKKFGAILIEMVAGIVKVTEHFGRFLSLLATGGKIEKQFDLGSKSLDGYAQSIRNTVYEQAEMAKHHEEIDRLVRELNQELDQKAAIDKYANALAKASQSAKEMYKELNAGIDPNNVKDIGAYFEKLEKIENLKLVEKFKAGTISLEQFNISANQLKELQLNRDFKTGSISLEEFNQKLEENKLEELRFKLEAGKLSWQAYRSEVDKTSTSLDSKGLLLRGAERYISSIGSQAQAISGAIEKVFTSLEDSMLEFIQTGTQDWKKFAQSILDEINKIIIRYAIVRPLAAGIEAALSPAGAAGATPSGGSLGQTAMPFSDKLSGFSGQAKASAGISSPSYFKGGMSQVTGSSTYAAPSTSSPVEVNIINNAGAEIRQQEKTGPNGERILDLIIASKVRDGIASGKFDKSFGQAYGIKRKGN